MRPVGISTGWAERLADLPGDRDLAADAALTRAQLDIGDEVERAAPIDAGTDAVATVGGRGRSAARAVAMSRALAETRTELRPFAGDFGQLTDALAGARAHVEGDLAGVLDKYIGMRRRVAAGIGSIASG